MTKERLHLAMEPGTKKQIEDIQRRTASGSMTEVLRRALALLDVVTAEEEAGNHLYAYRKKDGTVHRIVFI